MIEPGQTCPTCERRVNHPRKESSPSSRVKSLRIPADDETFDSDFAEGMAITGIRSTHKYPAYKFLRFVTDLILRDRDEWENRYAREWEA